MLGSLLNARAETSVARDLTDSGSALDPSERGTTAHLIVAQHGAAPSHPGLNPRAAGRYFASGFVDGLHASLLVAGVATALATLAILLRLRTPKPNAEPAPAPVPAPQRPTQQARDRGSRGG
ncbi:hypothetical protein AB5J72_02960 [Streptomyces sp. CG1]|uniref:hypothetical protein n=1 Tax=Streptomyces sp. CG1 TaxID=1287523 RepID=UPI0034E23175